MCAHDEYGRATLSVVVARESEGFAEVGGAVDLALLGDPGGIWLSRVETN